METFIPIFDQECNQCGDTPCVGVRNSDNIGIRSTGVCGLHFFFDRSMIDWEVWNDPVEGTE